MSNPLVSVLMLTYNHGAYIAQAIESVLSQETAYPFELIICDDASTDDTRKIAEEYAAKDQRIILSFQPTNTKFGKNFADGCQKIRGKYVAFCEGDDYWTDRQKMQKQVSFLESNPDFAIAAHKVQMLDMGNRQPSTTPQFIYKDCTADEQRIRDGVFYADEAINNYYFQTGSLVLRWIFPNGLPHWFRKRMMFDHFMLMLHAVTGKIKYFDEPMSVWRRHGGGYTWLQTQDKGLFFQKEGTDWINMYREMDRYFSGRFHPQIRERINLALRSIIGNAIETANTDQLRQLVNAHEPYFRAALRDAPLIDAIRIAYPEQPEFSPPWESIPVQAHSETIAAPVGGISQFCLDEIPVVQDSVWNEWTHGTEYTCFFNVTSALLRYLWQRGVSTIWLPAYLPPMLEFNRFQCQITRKFYRLNQQLEPDSGFLAEMAPGEAIITISYLGRPLPKEFAEKLHGKPDIVWVEDLAQCLDRTSYKADAAIYNPRKFFGVPDGAIITGNNTAELASWLNEKDAGSLASRWGILLEGYEKGSANPQAAIKWKKDELEHQLSRARMSRATESLLRRIPYKSVSETRKSNWRKLFQLLGEYCLWQMPDPSFTPFAFPFLAPSNMPVEIIHTLLSRNGILCERMWHPLPVPANLFPVEEGIAKRLLLLPCDQRYGDREMERIAQRISGILSGEYPIGNHIET